jgi:cobyrinic acid a,c-diamide synthase
VPRFLIAAAHKSSGKTVISTGLAAALTTAGKQVQCFKKGPDYIDPMWLAAASGRPCYNLDFNTMTGPEITALVASRATGAGMSLIEANKGLFDGVALDGRDSNAALAKQLSTPVVLVIDTNGMTRGIAPLLLGYQGFDDKVDIAGVILNNVGGARHEAKLRAAVDAYTDLPVLGAVWRNPALNIGERHLGLTTPAETGELARMIRDFGDVIASSVNLEDLANRATQAPELKHIDAPRPVATHAGLRIAVARDQSFGFYYPDDLEAFEALGATLVSFDTLRDKALPDADGLFIGGGFPEMQMAELGQNIELRENIRSAIENGLPTYAECGGLMYLCQSLRWGDQSAPMCGVIPADAVMCPQPQGRGYSRFRDTSPHPWRTEGPQLAHEFHYARIEDLAAEVRFGRAIERGHGIDGRHDAVVLHNLVAGFCHLRNTERTPWVARFLDFVGAHSKQA